ncbi:MAG: FHA domain-containing protein [Chloroflexota bacterium]|nr:FHA domain-containing protein [Chloroflexota bacterium]MDE3103381.1 FHA domain-containing protein [Chloroflexota bacterium]
MEIPYQLALWGVRIAFLLVLYILLVRSFGALWRTLRTESELAARPALAYLIVQRSHATGPRVGERLPLRAASTIGRDSGNDVVINDDAASARHALIQLADGSWWIEDQGSTNGTLLNGSRLARRERIRDGDVLDVGRVALRFEATL